MLTHRSLYRNPSIIGRVGEKIRLLLIFSNEIIIYLESKGRRLQYQKMYKYCTSTFILIFILLHGASSQIDILADIFGSNDPCNAKDVTNSAICIQCKSGYSLSSIDSTCYPNIANCIDQDGAFCNECSGDLIPSQNKKACIIIPRQRQCNQLEETCSAQHFSKKALEDFSKSLPANIQIPTNIEQQPLNDVIFEQTQNQNKNQEPELMRTDGTFIYTFGNRVFSIFRAYPSENAQLLSSINLSEAVQGLFLGEKYVALFGSIFSTNPNTRTIITLIDITNRTRPRVYKKFEISGQYFDSRLTPEGYCYMITKNSLSKDGIPWYNLQGTKNQLPLKSFFIYNPTIPYESGIFLTIFTFKLDDPDNAAKGIATLITEAALNMYMSDRAIYVSYPKIGPGFNDITILHKVFVQRSKIIPNADQTIQGTVVNQYAFDEFEGVLRVASTRAIAGDSIVSCLDNNLNEIGLLKNIGTRDKIFSARFTNDRLYLSTFNRIDPFFVINLSDPTNPYIMGELIVTGFSRHLFIFSDDIILGFGRETTETGEIKGLKVLLLDVSDPRNPRNISSQVVSNTQITSSAEFDERALLLSRTKNTLIVPAKYQNPTNPAGSLNGVIIFYVDRTIIQYRGFVNLLKDENAKKFSDYTVQRSSIIEEMMYIKSRCRIQVTRIFNLETMKKLQIPPCQL